MILTCIVAAVTFAGDFPGDPAVRYVQKDAGRFLRDAKGTIELRADPSLPDRSWRFVSEGGERLVIRGRDEKSVIYGIYTFLEKHMGARWYAPDTERFPDLKDYRFPKIDEIGKCAYYHFYMGTGFKYQTDVFWQLRNKQSEMTAYSVGVNQGLPGGNHTHAAYVREIRKRHPELFGNRPSATPGRKCETLCLTDPRMAELVAEQMLKYIRADRERVAKGDGRSYHVKNFYDLGQEDGPGGEQCMCDTCRAALAKEGSYAGLNIAFCNAVAKIVNRIYPDVKVRTLAYAYVADPPERAVADENVVVRYCRAWVQESLVPGSPRAKEFLKWCAHAKTLGIWSYWRTYYGSMGPRVKRRKEISAEMRFCHEHGARHYYAEDEDAPERSFAFLQQWLFFKLAENPYQDVDPLAAEFMSAYYGRAAKPMTDYLDYLERRQPDEDSSAYLDRELFEIANGFLDRAEELAAGDEKSLRHIRWERVVVDRSMYDRLAGLLKEGFVCEKEKVHARFSRNAVELIANWSSGDDGFRRVRAERLADVEREVKLYAHYPVSVPELFGGHDVVTLEAGTIRTVDERFTKRGNRFELVDDPEAAAGSAFRFTEKTPTLPWACGFYNHTIPWGETLKLSPEDIVPGGYHPYRVGHGLVMKPMFFFFGPDWDPRHYMNTLGIIPEDREIWVSAKFTGPVYVKGSDEENHVFIDRLYLVKAKMLDWYGEPVPGQEILRGASSGVVKATAAASGYWNSKCLGDPERMERDLCVRGSVRYRESVPRERGSVILRGEDASGKTAFSIPLVDVYNGSETGRKVETVVTARQIRQRVTSAQAAGRTGPFRLFLTVYVPKGLPTEMEITGFSICPVVKKDGRQG